MIASPSLGASCDDVILLPRPAQAQNASSVFDLVDSSASGKPSAVIAQRRIGTAENFEQSGGSYAKSLSADPNWNGGVLGFQNMRARTDLAHVRPSHKHSNGRPYQLSSLKANSNESKLPRINLDSKLVIACRACTLKVPMIF
jgi:hypothetical protein